MRYTPFYVGFLRLTPKILTLSIMASLLLGCAPQNTSTPAPSAKPTAAPTPRPTPIPVATPAPAATVKEIQVSSSLGLRVDEELLLIGDVLLSDGKKLAIDTAMSLLTLSNQSPDLISLNPATRLIRGLKPGTATLTVASKTQPGVQLQVSIRVEAPGSGIDPNVALVDIEIE